jgi:DNA ligase-1
MIYPTLYKQNKNSSIQSWSIWTENNIIFTKFGILNGAQQVSQKIILSKNVGSSNETSPDEQAEKEALSTWKHKLKSHYSETISYEKHIAPMLAAKFEDHKHRLSYYVDVQPKLDGCVFRTTNVLTIDGPKTIEEIVENKLKTSVMSFNEETGIFEYKPIVNWFNNGKLNYHEWLEIVPKNGKHIKCTKNHKFLTNFGWKEANDLNSKTDKIFCNQFEEYRIGLIAGTLLGDSSFCIDRRGSGTSYRLTFQHVNKKYFDFKIKVLGLAGKTIEVTTGYGSKAFKFVSNAITNCSFPISLFYHIGHHDLCGKRKIISTDTLKEHLTLEGLSLWIADDGSINYNNGNLETPRLSLSTHNFCDEQITNIVEYFREVFDCVPSIYTDKRVQSNGKFLTFSTKDTFFILTLLRNKQVKGCEYKFFYNTQQYLEEAKDEFKFISFSKRNSRNMPQAIKYDIEVKDNHNYVANNIVIHNCRALSYWEDDRIVLLSRGNKEYNVSHIKEQLKLILPKNMIFDGEIYTHGTPFQTIMSWIKKETKESSQLQYWIYDAFEIGKENTPWHKRNDFLKGLISYQDIEIVQSEIAHNEQDVYNLQAKYVSQGFEGAIVRSYHAPYTQGFRSNDLLKVKSFQDHEYPVISFSHGQGKFQDCVIWICLDPSTNQTFSVVPKASSKEKQELLINAPSYLGQLLKVKFFGLTDSGLPRFPVGLGFRLPEDL